MRKGTLISLVIALIAVAGALLGLVAYMRSRRCLECESDEDEYVPDTDYGMEYYMDGHTEDPACEPAEESPAPDPEADDITD